MNQTVEELTAAVEREARKRPEVLLMTHSGVGALTALAYVLIIGTPTRFPRGKRLNQDFQTDGGSHCAKFYGVKVDCLRKRSVKSMARAR
jgi:hypothetical protein